MTEMLSVRRLKPVLLALSLLIIAYNLMPDIAPLDIHQGQYLLIMFNV